MADVFVLIILFMFLLVGLAIYFIPTFIAVYLKHPHTVLIFLFNLLLGWTFLGWTIAIVWALWREIRSVMRDLERDREKDK